AGHEVQAAYALALIPAVIGAAGGRVAGMLLDTAANRLEEARRPRDESIPWFSRPASRRFVLAMTLIGIAIAGYTPVESSLVAIGHRAPAWLALVWQIMSLVGWIGLTPFLLDLVRRAEEGEGSSLHALTPALIALHVSVVLALAVLHAALIVVSSGALFVPIEPSWSELTRVAFIDYLPLDLLVYVAIVTLGFASDVARQQRAAAQRESALRAESLDSRLSALRAR